MARLVTHVVVYAAICGFLTALWLLTGGSVAELRSIRDADDITRIAFWPVWPIVGWGTVVVIHAGTTLSRAAFGKKARRRRAKMARALVPRRRRASPTPGRHWVAVLFADVVDSTGLNERLGDESYSRLLVSYRRIVRSAARERGGREVGTQGDGILVRFPSPAEAVLCGVDIQRELGELDVDGASVRARIGIHAGEAVVEDGDLVGRVVNLASRVTAEAEPGEILITEPVSDHLGGDLGFEDRGLRTLKGVSGPRHLLAVVWQEGQPTS